VPVTGGTVRRLTTNSGQEVRAAFSPDGAWFGAGYALKEKAWTEASALVG
jgi:hypothetical protein